MKKLKDLVFDQSGMAAYLLSAIIAAVGLTASFMMEQDRNTNKSVVKEIKRQEGKIVISKLGVLGQFLISSNTIACKIRPFKGATEGNRCVWTGKQISAGSIVDIQESKLGFIPQGYDQNGFLVYKVDTSQISLPEDLQGADYELAKVKGEIAFKLYDLKTDSLGIADSLGGGIPKKYIKSDFDTHVVLIKVLANYGEMYKLSSSTDQDGNQIQQRELSPGFSEKKYFAVRRSMAIPKLTVNSSVCKLGCRPGLNSNNNPGCRSAQKSEFAPEVALTGTLENMGPGLLMDAVFQQDVTFADGLFENVPNVEPSAIDTFAAAGVDYLHPGESLTFTTNVTCYTFETTGEEVTVYQSNNIRDENGNPVCFSQPPPWSPIVDNPYEIPCPGAAASQSLISQHTQKGGSISFSINVSPIRTESLSDEIINSIFKESIVPFNPRIPDKHKNRSLSSLDPAKQVTRIDEVGDLPVSEKTITPMKIIATH